MHNNIHNNNTNNRIHIPKKIKNLKIYNPEKYLPIEEIRTLKQPHYLIMMLLFFIFILYNIIFQGSELTIISIIEIIITAHIASKLDYKSWKTQPLLPNNRTIRRNILSLLYERNASGARHISNIRIHIPNENIL